MATRRNYNKYQYETSPKKLQPEYEPKRNPYKKKKSSTKKTTQKKTAKQNRIAKIKSKTVTYIILGFIIFFAISYRNAQINESFAEIQKIQTQLAEVKKENEQLQVSIENSLNLNNVEKEARETLGMQKLENNQKVYVNLPKRDYVEPKTEEVTFDEPSFLDRIIESIMNIFN